MNTLDNIYFEIEKANDELKAIETMTEEQACDLYSCDFKEEAVTLRKEDLVVLRSNLEDEINRLGSLD